MRSVAAEDLAFEPRAPASGFLESINAFEETACWRARLKRNSRRICPEIAYITSLRTDLRHAEAE